MSAFIVSTAHIDALASALSHTTIVPKGRRTPQKIGAVLWRENHYSVNVLYQDPKPIPRYVHTACLARPWVETLKLAESYAYQACEHEGWIESDARRWITALIAELKEKGASKDSRAYDAAPWAIA